MTADRPLIQPRFQILSLDGGGLKGLFAAAFLTAWEETEKVRVVERFDLIAGTSTGGIIALALGLGFSAREVLGLYINEAERIFPAKTLAGLKHFASVKYKPDGLDAVLDDYFKDRRLGESCVPLIIPAYYPKARDIYIFKTPHHPRLRTDLRERVKDVARATAAAPSYFPAYKSNDGVELIDGGVWANNPVMLAVVEAMGYFNTPQSHVAALRIGTTTTIDAVESARTDGGKIAIAEPVIRYMMRGQERSASGMAGHLLGAHFHEINIPGCPGDFELDKLNENLTGLGKYQWRLHSSDLAEKGFLSHQPREYVPCHSN